MDSHVLNPVGLVETLALLSSHSASQPATRRAFICNVGPNYEATIGEELCEPVATQFFSVEQLKAERLRGLYRNYAR